MVDEIYGVETAFKCLLASTKRGPVALKAAALWKLVPRL